MIFGNLIKPVTQVIKPNGKGYRPDIDGLRAIAVLAVVAYHYFPTRFPGGFIGVDIFFVLSGYLITSILVRSLETNSFGHTLWKFYQHRIRRIFPAVVIVLGITLMAGWLLLSSSEYEALSKHVTASAGFVENLLLWGEAGYFDADVVRKPLLHFWSLAVEEQFYIFWPFVLWFSIRRKWPLLDTISAIIITSFAAGVWAVWKGDTNSGFYLPQMRTWELMAGAWLSVAYREDLLVRVSDSTASQISWLGLLLITFGFLVIRPDGAFPGAWALLPVVGCVLIIFAGPGAAFNRLLLSWRPAVWVGLISFPLYLWHWALWSMVETIFGSGSLVAMRNRKIGLIALSVLLAWFVYRFVEQPIRKRGKAKVTFTLMAIMVAVGGGAFVIASMEGVPLRPWSFASGKIEAYRATVVRSELTSQCADILSLNKSPHGKWYCIFGDMDAAKSIFVTGDSHAESMIPALDKYGRSENYKIIYGSESGCAIFLDSENVKQVKWRDCSRLAELTVGLAEEMRPKALIMIQSWRGWSEPGWLGPVGADGYGGGASGNVSAEFEHGLRSTLSRYQAASIPVIIFEDNPFQKEKLVDVISNARFLWDIDDDKLNKKSVSRAEHVKYQAEINRAIESIASEYPLVSVFNFTESLCNAYNCPWVKNNNFLYYNGSHLSVAGSLAVYPQLRLYLNSHLRN